MGIPVAELQRRMTSAEFSEWRAFLAIEPDDGTRADYLAASIAALITRVEARLGGRPPELRGKLIQWDKRQQDDEAELAAMLESRLRNVGDG